MNRTEKDMQDSRSITPFGLRMPDGLRKYLRAEADKNRRSLNGEIVHRLERDWKESQQ